MSSPFVAKKELAAFISEDFLACMASYVKEATAQVEAKDEQFVTLTAEALPYLIDIVSLDEAQFGFDLGELQQLII